MERQRLWRVAVVALFLFLLVPLVAQAGWEQVGAADFAAGDVWYSNLALDSSGRPYVAYTDWGNDGKVSVMRFNGTAWEQVGMAGFSADTAYYISLAIDSSGKPYVGYQDWGNDGKASVIRFNGTKWEQVGKAGFSAGQAWYTSLALDSSGTPYVAYSDYANSDKASVMRFVANNPSPAAPVLAPVYKLLLKGRGIDAPCPSCPSPGEM